MNCIDLKMRPSHPPASDGNETTLKKGGKTPPNVTLNDIVNDLLLFFKGFECLREAKKEIQEKYDIEKQHGHYCWSADDIKRAWGKTQRMDKKSSRRKHWAYVMILQVIKIYFCDRCKQNAESGVESESRPTTSSTDEAPSPTEVYTIANSNNSKTKNADGLQSTVDGKKALGKAQGMKENPAGRSPQSNAEPQIAEGLKEEEVVKQQAGADSSGNKAKGTNHRANKESKSQLSTSSERDKEEVPKSLLTQGDGSCKEVSNESNPQTVYIRIPLSVMESGDASTYTPETVKNEKPIYKLIDRVPDPTEIIKNKKSYALLYDNRTRNAAWVYEILNESILTREYKKKNNDPYFEVDTSVHPFYQAPKSGKDFIGGYERGHLAAASNHRWCQEAYEDTFSISNMTTQDENLNRGIWEKLEEDCRTKISKQKNKIRNIHVYSGPLYLPNDSDEVHYRIKADKAVPTHFFKVIIVENKDDTVELKCYTVSPYCRKSPHSYNIIPFSIKTVIYRNIPTGIYCELTALKVDTQRLCSQLHPIPSFTIPYTSSLIYST